MKKILVVDDDRDILEAIQLILESGGYASDSTTKGDETYQKIGDFNPDLIILDVLLSGNDGRNICKKLKSQSNTQQIPIIMISAHPGAKASVKDCGADSFLSKPFSVDSMLKEIEKLLH